MYEDGQTGEIFFKKEIGKYFKQNQIIKIDQPADFIVNTSMVEVKSSKLYIKSKGKIAAGRYEFHSKKQLEKIKHMNIWICFIVHANGTCLIQGFMKSSKLPNQLRLSRRIIQKDLVSLKDFLRLVK